MFRGIGTAGIFAVSLVFAAAQAEWSQPPNTASGGAIPDNFRGQITYRGRYDGNLIRKLHMSPTYRDRFNSGGEPFQGDYVITLEFSGNTIKGTHQMRNAGLHGSLTGTRNGTTCTLVDDGQGFPFFCDMSQLSGNFDLSTERGNRLQFHVEARAANTVDLAQRDIQRAEQQRVATADAQRLSEIRTRNNAVAYDPAAALPERMDAIAEIDSRSWLMWRYRPGSMRNVTKFNVSSASTFDASGDFTYGDGRAGRLFAHIVSGKFQCLRFANEPQCRAIGHPPSHDFAGSLIGALAGGMANGAGGSPASGTGAKPQGANPEMEFNRLRQREQQQEPKPQPAPPPVAPISPFYGECHNPMGC